MGRERRRDGRANATPPQRIEVDLTRVCVRRGSVQLPYRLQGAFRQGPVSAVDAAGGEALELRFEPPRELVGLGPFFERHALRANDAIGLILDGEALEIEAVRRERRAPATPDRTGAGSSAPPTARSSGADREARPDAPPAQQREPSSRSAAPSVPPTLRMEVPAASVPEEGGDVPTTDGGVPARPRARWEPLDVTMSAGAGEGHVGGATWRDLAGERREAADPTPRVREVRRQRTDEAQATPGGQAAREAPSQGAQRPTTGGAGPRPGPSDAPERRAQGEEPDAPVQGRGLDLFGLRRRLGIGRAGTTRVVDSGAGASSGPAGGEPASPPTAPGPARTGRPASDASAHRPAAQAPLDFAAANADAGGGPAGVATAAPTPASTGPQATAVRTAVATVRRGAAEGAPPPTGASLDADVAAVAGYLARPDIPAIVRAERVAETLAMSVARADAALDRIAEDSERLSRIRAQAYMVRRRSQG